MIEWIKKATSKNVTGNYKFYIKSQPQNADTGTTITVTAYTDKSETAIVPCHYKWFRIRNGISQESYKYRGNTYVCDSSDIGAIIMAEVTSNDIEYSGQAKVQFGPIKLQTQIKKHLMDTLTNGSAFIRGMICLNQMQQKQCQFKIFEDMVKICHLQSQLNYSFHYNIFEPKIQLIQKDPTKLVIVFVQNYENSPHAFLKNLFGFQYEQFSNQGGQCRMEIRFPSRMIKQIFYLTMKAFYTKNQLKNSVIMHKIQETSFNQNQNLNLLFQVESLRSDISRLYYSNQQKEKDKTRLSHDVHRLQKQIEQVVATYARFADQKVKNVRQLNQSYSVLTTKRDEVFGRKCQNLQKQNGNLNERIRLLTAQIDEIRFNSSMAQKNQTIMNPNQNFTHVTTIRMANPSVRNDATSFNNILQHLSQSRVTQFNEQSFLSKKLQKVSDQKAQLEKKLQKSFRTIDDLQKRLKTQSSQPNHNNSAIQFNFGKKQAPLQINTSTYSMAVDMDRLKLQNSRLVGANQSLKQQNKNLQKQLSNASSRIIIKPNPVVAANVPSISQMNQSLKISTGRQNQLQAQNQNLKRELAAVKQSVKSQQSKVQKHLKDKIILQRKVDEVTKQLEMYKKNQQVLNRSQNLSMQMQDYNEEQIRVLRQNNQFLVTENERLNKLCQRFINEARQNPKLRKQILQLKQKLNSKYLNPEKSQVKSILSGSALNQSQTSEIVGRIL